MAESASSVQIETDVYDPALTPDSSSTAIQLVDQPHGGKIRRGNPGNKGGQGRIAHDVRQKLVGTFASRLHVIKEIADGVASVPIRVKLRDVLPWVKCECGHPKLEPSVGGPNGMYVEIPALGPPSPKDRLMALDLAAKYGLGAMKDVSTEQVRERMRQTLELIRQKCPPELAGELISAMRPIWL